MPVMPEIQVEHAPLSMEWDTKTRVGEECMHVPCVVQMYNDDNPVTQVPGDARDARILPIE